MIRIALVFIAAVVIASPVLAAGRPITIDDLLAVKSVSDPQISPDGKLVAYVVSEIDREKNKSNSDVWLVPIAGGEPKRLTTSPGSDSHPRWSPDGKSIAFVSDRSGSSQIWLLPMDGGEARQLSKLPIDVAGPIWSPKGDALAFVAEVYPGESPEATAKKDEEKAKEKSKVRTFDSLMIRHWTSWDEGKKSHLFVCNAKTGEAKDLTPHLKVNTPPAPFGGSNDYAWSADGLELAFTVEPMEDLAWSTNTDIWTVPSTGGTPKNVTVANKGADAQPLYSPDGKRLAWVSQARPGFEADVWVLKVRDLSSGTTTSVGASLDRQVTSFVWGRGSNDLFGVIDDEGTQSIVHLFVGSMAAAGAVRSHAIVAPKRVVKGGSNASVQVSVTGQDLVFIHSEAARPGEVFRSSLANSSERVELTHHNDALVAGLELNKAEGFTFKGARGEEVSGWLVKPPGFDPSKKYPVVFLIHGGPQGAWHDEWHARWNYPMFAAPGYAVVAINPRGSTGYGQKFTDEISTDWNGKVYEDLMMGLDHALKTYPFLDKDRMAAAGGSFGGYMVNWIAGHTDRFKTLVSHAGIFDLTSMNVTTEELWFSEWEFGGSPWDTPERHLSQSPSTYAKSFKTPTLVLHGALDFRVPEGQGLAMFTALQRQGVPSRFVYFPDEGHWILKPANRAVWWRQVMRWLEKSLKS
jgi:dipeptidyl aminopeptidase/acylaminoacyl peptidase